MTETVDVAALPLAPLNPLPASATVEGGPGVSHRL